MPMKMGWRWYGEGNDNINKHVYSLTRSLNEQLDGLHHR